MTGTGMELLMEKRHTLLGWGCIVVAAALLYNTILMPLIWRWMPDWVGSVLNKVPALVLVLLLTLLGVYLLRGPKAPAMPPEEDYTAFKGELSENHDEY